MMTTTAKARSQSGPCVWRRWKAQAALTSLLLVWLSQPTQVFGHPLGNFSINHYGAIRLEPARVELLYLIDMAEIPTFQELQEHQLVAEANHPKLLSYLASKAEALKRNLYMEINGRRVALEAEPQAVIFPEGAGGMPTLKLAILYRARFEPGPANSGLRLRYADSNYPERVGWKEIVVEAKAGVSLVQSSAPQRDRSSQLSDYPTDLLNSAPQDLEASVVFSITAPGAGFTSPSSETKVSNASLPPGLVRSASEAVSSMDGSASESKVAKPNRGIVSKPKVETIEDDAGVPLRANRQNTPRNMFTELIATQQWNLGMLLLAFGIAAGLGALHALEPGHGKTLVAAYLVGSRGTIRHALVLGLIVTAAHTAGVYLLGAVTLYASSYIVPETLYPWLALSSGLMILGLGCVLFLRRYRGADTTQHRHHHAHDSHDHPQGAHVHHHAHGHAHPHRHHQEMPQEISLKQLLALGISGGIVPCPAALVVLLSAVSLQRIGFGLLLILAFSIGLAAVLIAIGLLMVCAQTYAARFKATGPLTTRWLPVTSAAFIVLFGIAITWQALGSAGLKIFPSF